MMELLFMEIKNSVESQNITGADSPKVICF